MTIWTTDKNTISVVEMTVFCCVVFSRETTTMQLYSTSLCLLMFAVVQYCSAAGVYIMCGHLHTRCKLIALSATRDRWSDLTLFKLTAPIKNIELSELSAKFNVNMFWTCCAFLFFMVALCNRADHYIFILFLLSSSFFPRLISTVGDWMLTILWHMVWP